jgi:hypothetical protein
MTASPALVEMIASERLALVDLLDTLDAGEWATRSLCSAWTVQDVAAHLVAALSDAVLHALDIRRPLGRNRVVPADVFVATAEFHAGLRWPLTASVGGDVRRRITGLRLVADDADWSHGQGPEVHGSAEALLLMLTGRPVGRDELTGPGAPTLCGRLP